MNIDSEAFENNTAHVHSCGPQCNHANDSLYVDSVTGTEGEAGDLLSGAKWFASDGEHTQLNYKFITSTPGYYDNNAEEGVGFKAFTNKMQGVTLDILEQIESFTNIQFTETNIGSSYGTITLGQASLPSGIGAWAYYPTTSHVGGDVWLNAKYVKDSNVDLGEYGHFTIMHEIGHALGLQHSFKAFDGYEATSRFSVMAYDWAPGYSQTYQLYDIASLQQAYGANMDHNTGDDTYVLKSGALYTIWDAGGIDTFDASVKTIDVIIDLEDGAFSSVGKNNNIAIAYDAIIENATGGSGNDTLSGNDADNILTGNNGNDKFYATLGDDIIKGGAGNDTIYYQSGFADFTITLVDAVTVSLFHIYNSFTDIVSNVEKFFFNELSYSFDAIAAGDIDPDAAYIINGTAGVKNVLRGTASDDVINGYERGDTLYGEGGDDTLHGEQGRDKLYGGIGEDTLYGGDLQDKLYGGDGNDFIYGGANGDQTYGGAGDDIIEGGHGNDVLRGQDGNDTLYGGDGNDKLVGHDGDDILNGGAGRDLLYGRDGSDIFVLDDLTVRQTKIMDFNIAEDRLDISALLTQYDAATDSINDFVSNVKVNGTRFIAIDQDGTGTDFGMERVVKIYGSRGLDGEEMDEAGLLII